jgi:hypothetical protein
MQKQQLRLHQQANNLEVDNDDNWCGTDDLPFHRGRDRPVLTDDAELSSYVCGRLALERHLALARYREIYQT